MGIMAAPYSQMVLGENPPTHLCFYLLRENDTATEVKCEHLGNQDEG